MSRAFALSVKALLRSPEGSYLAIRRSDSSRNNAGRWDLPGGKVDHGESFDQGLIREIHEETGLEIDLERPVGLTHSALPDRTVVYIVMEGRVAGGTLNLSGEHGEVRWVPIADLPSLDWCPQFADLVSRFATQS